MPSEYFVENGWLGTTCNGSYYLYNSVAKEFAVFRSRETWRARASTGSNRRHHLLATKLGQRIHKTSCAKLKQDSS